MEFFTSARGGQKISLDGYIYTKQKNLANNVVSYECEKRRQNGGRQGECRAKIKVRGQELIGRTNDHSHGPAQSTIEVQKVRAAIRERAAMTEEAPQRILADTLVTCTQGILYIFIYSYKQLDMNTCIHICKY